MDILTAFALTLVAGLSTGIGGFAAFFTRSTNNKFLSVSLGFSAGVMIYVSMTEILGEAGNRLGGALGSAEGAWITAAAFFGGMLFIAVIDRLIPQRENPHELVSLSDQDEGEEIVKTRRLMRTGVLSAVAIAIHNFPEGLATFVSALQEPEIAVPVVAAIAIHNIPEGIAVAVPIYRGTGSRKKAFFYSLLSGLAEPLGALIGWLILMPVMNDAVFGAIYAAVAGIMVFIALDELLPAAREYGKHHLSIYGLIAGMAVMAVSLILL